MTKFIVVSGTGTEIGKTVATAALAAREVSDGTRVGIAKPIQTGLEPGEDGDCHVAARLAGITAAFEHRRLREPLAPETAARRAGEYQSTAAELAQAVRHWASGQDLDVVFVEGAGGVLARLGTDTTIIDVARELDAPVVLVTSAELGTLSATELATRYLRAEGLECLGLVIGSWPDAPDLAQRCNVEDLPRLTGERLLGAVPRGAGSLAPEEFAHRAPGWFCP
ncbi:dethiobiotin synthase [Corynebacterium lipophiloflavum]|uniref:ATP-dependent dethiobiotin synthetase BioD n=1 Tax=Corynebacterium lipophiloflavum (strain ATCC 700352 / DSM 44291 / CCUG 37336 / JCM 10383 / DMMZ 1944) TaxID=525263 RepID=C0XR83_CORLD|nr:dethiobiotin synthase [Corynebacterium lipophiloflavum]EEI17217.1 dethiobiotin synthase [Corynebacterium lipophiloflavum DSM 44291]